MPLYRRTLAAACVLAPLFYVYWLRFTNYDRIGGFGGWFPSEDVFNKTLGFSKILVINLPSRTDRRDSMALVGAVSNLTFTWIDGVSGDQVTDLAAQFSTEVRSSGSRGSWRSHMNALHAIVKDNLESALILEDDIDWDIRLKSQLHTFASASRTWLRESKSDKNLVRLLDFAPLSLQKEDDGTANMEYQKDTIQLNPNMGYNGHAHKSPYGEDWDVLWLGHCGTDFPSDKPQVNPLKITIPGDDTVPAPRHLKPHPFALLDKLGEIYPPHTRIVHASSGTVCSLAYAVSHQGARKLLQEFDSHYDTQWDLMLQKWCEGGYVAKDKAQSKLEDSEDGHKHNANAPVCLTVQPPLFSHHYAKGGSSNIQGQGGGYATGTGTPYIRLSVRENLKRLIAGAPEGEMIDQLPDDGKPIWK
ncbi:glycosyltransferase family 25 protein [Annulohypoxylon maeteangense]|uniref:glycosyltransferase family 25 protein n=1 Tax=Annulohypoxylon maeteangense TaxID=1927788 RepID=UPI002008847F|nr:glycosyltransferase family 25 protein [Annulohypoxylon maeteangense]KAI0886206.1 glycosyltransferase family 25 protein [Annulohypoxylon maeteangense]